MCLSVNVTAHKYQTNQCDQVQHRSSALQSFKEITTMLFRYEARSQAGVPGCSKYRGYFNISKILSKAQR